MVNLLVDEAYAFDYLSILYIKRLKSKESFKLWEDCLSYIKNQLPNFDQIISSKEYENMIEANQITFDAVEKARYGSITAKEVDEANMLRYNRKRELQKKFFNSEIKEFKS